MSLKDTIGKISKVIIVITLVNIFAYFVYLVNTRDDENLGIIPLGLKKFSRIPVRLGEVIEGIKEETYAKTDQAFKLKNDLSYDLYALNGNFLGPYWAINLTNLKNDSLIHQWRLNQEDFIKTERFFDRTGPRMPIILPDQSLVLTMDESNNIYRIDKASNILWHTTDHQYHHSINLGADGNVWACTRKRIHLKKQNINYWQNSIVKLDVRTGQTLLKHEMNDVFFKNGLGYLVHGSSNAVNRIGHDPLHLNDIEPVLNDGPYWKRGDLFLSFRNKSLIVLYRPSTQKILRTIQGPFFNQHDVDILNDSTISVFNNNVSSLRKIPNLTSLSDSDFALDDDLSLNTVSGVITYSFGDSTFASVYPWAFNSEQIYTETEGLHHFTQNGDLFIESQNNGRIYLINAQGTVLRDYMNTPTNGRLELSHWIRIYEHLNF